MSYPTKKLQEILDKSKFTIWKIKTSDYLISWKNPIIDQWKSLIAWYSNNEELVYNWKLPVIIYWDHTNIVKYVDFPFIWWADWIKVLPFNNSCDVRYCYYLLENFKPDTQWYRRHFSFFKEIDLPFPPLPTQKLIVQKLDSFFEKIDKSIEITKKNLENLEQLNKSVLGEVFKEWEFEMKKLWEICEFWPKKNETKILDENTLVSFVPMKYVNEKQIYFESDEEKELNEVYKWYTYFAENDVLLAKVTPCFENWKSWIAKNLKNWIWFGSSEFYVFRMNWNAISEWIYYLFITDAFLKEWANNMSWAVWLKRVTKDFILNYKLPLPPLPKQKEIVSYLDKIFEKNKTLKEKYERKLKDLEELKQSLLKEAFEWRLIK